MKPRPWPRLARLWKRLYRSELRAYDLSSRQVDAATSHWHWCRATRYLALRIKVEAMRMEAGS